MKIKYRHKLNIRSSRVFEVLALINGLAFPIMRQEIIELGVFDPLARKHKAIIDKLRNLEEISFGVLELALLSEERDCLCSFFDEIEKLEKHLVIAYLLGHRVDYDEINVSLDNLDLLEEALIKEGFPVGYASRILDLYANMSMLKALAIDISKDDLFLRALQSSELETKQVIETFTNGMKERHPLSYAQELMGKPFWNISDYISYEFVPVYFISPWRLRLMDDKKMIYIHSIKRLTQSSEDQLKDLAEGLKILGDLSRLKILRLIYMRPMFGKEISKELDLSAPTVSHHLETLRSKGFVNLEQVKHIKYFSTNLNKIKALPEGMYSYILGK